jgi:hypothetical protein
MERMAQENSCQLPSADATTTRLKVAPRPQAFQSPSPTAPFPPVAGTSPNRPLATLRYSQSLKTGSHKRRIRDHLAAKSAFTKLENTFAQGFLVLDL